MTPKVLIPSFPSSTGRFIGSVQKIFSQLPPMQMRYIADQGNVDGFIKYPLFTLQDANILLTYTGQILCTDITSQNTLRMEEIFLRQVSDSITNKDRFRFRIHYDTVKAHTLDNSRKQLFNNYYTHNNTQALTLANAIAERIFYDTAGTPRAYITTGGFDATASLQEGLYWLKKIESFNINSHDIDEGNRLVPWIEMADSLFLESFFQLKILRILQVNHGNTFHDLN